jgi:DNA invertase Pin-like site-specific DNA recombinase
MTQQDYSNNTAPKSGRAAIYARVTRTQAPQPQTAALIALANEQGFSNERIIVYEDENPSAKRPIARRGALSDLLAAIMQEDQTPEHEPIRAIYVSSEDRLFRDANSLDLAYFISVCADHGIQLLTPTATYDFTAPDQAALFRFQCEQAADYIAGQIGKLTHRGWTRGQAGQKPAEA